MTMNDKYLQSVTSQKQFVQSPLTRAVQYKTNSRFPLQASLIFSACCMLIKDKEQEKGRQYNQALLSEMRMVLKVPEKFFSPNVKNLVS